MNRIQHTLKKLEESGKKMLSPYITAGDPAPDITVNIMHALVDAGADILELGIPFSDPMAEGTVIQAAMERALKFGVNTDDVLAMVSEFRIKDTLTPIVLMGYMNPIMQYGYEKFAENAKAAGIDAMIIVDMPPEESHELASCFKAQDLYNIYLCSPTTSDQRMRLVQEYANGYLYYVSLKGVTGSSAIDLTALKSQYNQRKTLTTLPLMVGFGIKTPEMAAAIAEFADGVIVGAALINEIHEANLAKKDCIKAGAFLINNMRLAMDNKG